MSRKQRKPTWLIPYGLVFLMIVALVLEGRDGLPGWANEVTAIGIVILVFTGILLWVNLNAATLQDEEIEQAKHEKLVITEYPPTQPREHARNESGDGAGDDTKDSFSDFHGSFQINPVMQYRN
jgi:hypothetical protein